MTPLSSIHESDKTLVSILNDHLQKQTFNNAHLYRDALWIGTSISLKTKIGDVVLLSKQSNDFLLSAFMGCILFGRKPLIIQRPSPKVHPEMFEKRMQELKSKVNVTLCFCETENLKDYEKYFSCADTLFCINPSNDLHVPSPDDVAFLQMSSGTTGLSKICEVTHRILVNQCVEYGKVIGMDASKSVVSWLPLYHDMGLIAAFMLPLIHDAQIHIIDPFEWLLNPKSILEMVSKYKGTHLWMPNFAFKYLVNRVNNLKNVDLSSLEKVISCSEPTFADDLSSFKEKFSAVGLSPSSVSNCYALAENVFAVSQSDTIKTKEKNGIHYTSCGQLVPGVSVSIVKNNQDVTGQMEGNVMIKSHYTPKTNVTSSFNGYYDTGDIGFIEQDELYIMGRSNDHFVSYGVNVYPEVIEHYLNDIEGIIPGRVVCFGVYMADQGTEKLYVCAESNASDIEGVKKEIALVIKENFDLSPTIKIVSSGELIKTSSGKLSRKENKRLYGSK